MGCEDQEFDPTERLLVVMQFPPDASVFNPLVWQIVRQVPAGQVTTFGQIASMIPAPVGIDVDEYARFGPVWVGKAMNAVSITDDPTVPWQRVINSQGGISLPVGSAGALTQRRRLEEEGVTFDKQDRVNLNLFGWEGPSAEWLRENGLRVPRPLRKADDPPGQLKLF
jgi:methylated-DNA-protein-cysteine methyltransferase related protein